LPARRRAESSISQSAEDAVRNLRRAGVAETVIMKITGHRTRSVFERYNLTDHSDTQEAGRKTEEFLAREQEEMAQKAERPN
jgi:hypothetical protein